MLLSPGTRLGPYEVIAAIGAGGMGEVYRARDTRLARDVAVKILPEAVASDPAAVARFSREARAVAALSHPNIVAIHDVGTEGDTAVDVMHAVLHRDPPALAVRAPDSPPELQRIVARCLAKDPEERYQSTRDLVVELRALARQVDSGAVPWATAPRPVTRFVDQDVLGFDLSPDGKRLAVARGVLSRDAVRIRNFR